MKKWREMQKNKFLNSSFSKNRLSQYSKSDNIKTNNTLHDIFKNNKTLLFSFLPIAFFILLDYYTLSYHFNFSSASFIEIYFNSLNLSSQILVLVSVFPLVIIFVFFTIPHLNSFVLEMYNSSIKKPATALKKILISLFITIVLFISSTLSYWIFLKIEGYGFIVLILTLLLPLLLTSLIINSVLKLRRFNIDIKVIIKDSPILFGFSFSISYVILIFISYNTLLDIFNSEAIVPFLMLILIHQLITMMLISGRDYSSISKTNTKNKFFTLKNICITLLSIMLAIYFVDRTNKNLWEYIEEEANFSFNLFINKFFLSDNHIIIDINATYYDNDTSEIKQCWDNKIKKIHIDSNQTTYLPISNEMKLYFKKENENITCVYAINKNQYNYRLQDIGFIDTQKRRDFGKAITKDKK